MTNGLIEYTLVLRSPNHDTIEIQVENAILPRKGERIPFGDTKKFWGADHRRTTDNELESKLSDVVAEEYLVADVQHIPHIIGRRHEGSNSQKYNACAMGYRVICKELS